MLTDLKEITTGEFDGTSVRGVDGRAYPVSENYISKSKLVEGDVLKVYLTPEGRVVFKQVQPVKRRYAKGVVLRKEDHTEVIIDDLSYKVIGATARYFALDTGDEVSVVLPAEGVATYAAIENVIPEIDLDDKEL